MLPTGDEFRPRRDGWFEHRGQWGEVTVGTVIADTQTRTKRWEIVDVAHGTVVPPYRTLWMRAREQTTGEEFTVTPRDVRTKVVILTQDPADTETPPVTPPSDAEAVWAIVEELGATLMASIDNVTGEITCPDYIYESHIKTDGINADPGLREHLRVAHRLEPAADILEVYAQHAAAHDHNKPEYGKGGFAHRHTPEDLELVNGIR